MGSSPSVPTPENPSDVASTQMGYNTQAGEESQLGSMVNQSNPYGGLTYTQTGTSANGTPLYSASLDYSAPQQALLNAQEATQGTAAGQAYNLLGSANYGSVPTSTALGNETSGLTGQMMSGYLQSMEPFFQTQTNQLQTQLANEGLSPGPTTNASNPNTWNAYQNAMYGLQTSQANTVAGAAAQFEPEAYSQALSTYQEPATLATTLSEYASPTSPTSSLVTTPSLSIAPADYESDVSTAENMQMQDYEAELAQESSMYSALGGIGGDILGAGILKYSDRKLKKKLKHKFTLPNGIKVYEFEYKGSNKKHIGVIADEVRKIKPEAVTPMDGYGYDAVNYSMILD